MLQSTSLTIDLICRRVAMLVMAGLVATAAASCTTTLSNLPSQVGGLPQGTPERSATPPAYPAVHDMPPPRTAVVLSEDEKKKVEAELAAMRADQARRAAQGGFN